jgi:copper chaperone CopZ
MAPIRRTRIAIAGLGCGADGASGLERELAAIDGVLDVSVNPATDMAYLEFDAGRTDQWALARVIAEEGYQPGRPVEG